MRRVPLLASLGLISLSLLGAPGCAGDDPDPRQSTSTTTTPPVEGVALPGLEGEVEVVIDDRGMPHIYAELAPEDPVRIALDAFDAASRHLSQLGDDTRGSNNWVVSGSKTASGAPLLANDPHLSLPSPPLFWYAHMNTRRRGGDLNVQGLTLAGVPRGA